MSNKILENRFEKIVKKIEKQLELFLFPAKFAPEKLPVKPSATYYRRDLRFELNKETQLPNPRMIAIEEEVIKSIEGDCAYLDTSWEAETGSGKTAVVFEVKVDQKLVEKLQRAEDLSVARILGLKCSKTGKLVELGVKCRVYDWGWKQGLLGIGAFSFCDWQKQFEFNFETLDQDERGSLRGDELSKVRIEIV